MKLITDWLITYFAKVHHMSTIGSSENASMLRRQSSSYVRLEAWRSASEFTIKSCPL